MESFFEREFFVNNRARLRKLFPGNAPIVLTANGQMQRNADNTFAFRQDSNFWYLTGIDEPDIILVMDKDREYLVVPELEEVTQRFEGSLDTGNIMKRSGIETVLIGDAGWKQLSARLKRVKHVATLSPLSLYVSHYHFYSNPSRAALIERMKEANPTLEILDLHPQLVRMRMIKQPQELQAIQRAIDITSQTIKKVERKLLSLQGEAQILALINSEYILRGARHAFHPIVASGKNAVTLHYIDNNQQLAKNEFLVIDTGAEIENYAADITRTLHTGTPTRRQRTIYEAVQQVQAFALEHLTLGKSIRDYEKEVRHYMGEKLRELGLIRAIDEEAIRRFYPQSTSHYLGLDAHDSGDYDTPLEPNMVLTVEPGMYIAAEGIGVRIEDDVLITPKGHKVLSGRLLQNLN